MSRWRSLLHELFESEGEERRHPQLVPALIASALLHLFLFLIVPWLTRVAPPQEEAVVEIVPLVEEGEEYRIADIASPDVERRPEAAKFLGTHDSSVEEEQVSVAREAEQRAAGERREESPKKESPSRELFSFDEKLFSKPGESGATSAGNRLDDFYPDFKVGAKTYLNVLRYPQVEYFVRLKRAFKITFNPVPALRTHFSSTQISRGSIEVVMGVSVDASGELAELFVIRSSGISTYDAEGLRTVRASSPFSRPPQKFLDDDGLLRMSWTFTVYL